MDPKKCARHPNKGSHHLPCSIRIQVGTLGEVRNEPVRQKDISGGAGKRPAVPSSEERCYDAKASFWTTLRWLTPVFMTIMLAIFTLAVTRFMERAITVEAESEYLRQGQSKLETNIEKLEDKISQISERLARAEGKIEQSEESPYKPDGESEKKLKETPAFGKDNDSRKTGSF